jgi:hypothetical protein
VGARSLVIALLALALPANAGPCSFYTQRATLAEDDFNRAKNELMMSRTCDNARLYVNAYEMYLRASQDSSSCLEAFGFRRDNSILNTGYEFLGKFKASLKANGCI